MEGWLGQRAGIDECFNSFHDPWPSTKTHSTNHRRNTYTVTRKYLCAILPFGNYPLSRMAVGGFSMKSYDGGRLAVPTARLQYEKDSLAFWIVNFPLRIFPRRYVCRLTIAGLRKGNCFRQIDPRCAC